MTTYTNAVAARGSSVLSLGTLAAGTYVTSSAIDLTATPPEDVTFEVEAACSSTPDGNKQLKVFLKLSADNSNFGSGPESSTTTTDEPDLHPLGVLPMNTATTHRKFFSYALSLIPVARYAKIVVKNDMTAVALTSGNVYQQNVTGAS
jgi:hypothetical protein